MSSPAPSLKDPVDKAQLSTRAQYLLNSLTSAAAATYSEYPMQAIRARSRVDSLTYEFGRFIKLLENPDLRADLQTWEDDQRESKA